VNSPSFESRVNVEPLLDLKPLTGNHKQVFLVGRPPVGEFIGEITTQTVGGEDADIGELMTEWRTANDHVRLLESTEAGFADDPEILSLPECLNQLATKVQDNTVFRRAYQLVPTTIGMVELDRLIVYQKHIDLDHVQRIRDKIGSEPSEQTIFNLCVPLEGARAAVSGRRVAQNAFVFTSPSNDLRLLEPVLLQPNQVVNYTPPGHAAGIIALVVGFGPNCMAVLRVGGRLILQNGSHRAYALRELGITHTPAVIQDVSRREELELFGIPALSEHTDDYLGAPRPPLLKDFFDERLRKIMLAPPTIHGAVWNRRGLVRSSSCIARRG
jgi:hypothetical protein